MNPRAIYLFCIGLLSAGTGCRPNPPSQLTRPNVLLITIDTIRADHMGCYGYFRDTTPHIDALAKESIYFEQCIAPISTTLPSHLSMMTGLYPLEHGVLANKAPSGGRYVPSSKLVPLAELFQQAGYATAAFVSATPLKRFTGMDRGFEFFDEPHASRRIAGVTNTEALRWLDQKEERPFFLWIHYYDPHSPYHAPAPFDKHFRREEALDQHLTERQYYSRGKKKLSLGPSSDLSYARQMVNTYDGEILYTDDQVHQILEKIRQMGLWDNTIIALIGDHGEGLTQHGVHAHGHIWHEQLRVPFMIRVPRHPPQRISRLVSVVDFAPTLLGLFDLPNESALLDQCRRASTLVEPTEPNPILLIREPPDHVQGIMAVINGQTWKYMELSKSGDTRLFDLGQDPFELHDLATEQVEILLELASRLKQARSDQEKIATEYQVQTAPLSPAESDDLAGLGYMGDDEDDEGNRGGTDDSDP